MMQEFFIHLFKQHLARVEAPVLAEKVRRFRRLNFRKLSYADIEREIGNVLCFEDQAILMPMMGTYPAGSLFYRIRRLATDDRTFPLRGMTVEGDAWAPPASVTTIQRLNKAGEPLLYTTPLNFAVAIEELRVPEDEFFSLIEYRARTKIKVAQVGLGTMPLELTGGEHFKMELLNDFLEHEFTREVGKCTEHLYQISEIIAKDYFDLPPDAQDAWCYPSVAQRGGYIACFRPEQAREKLELLGVQICRYKREGDDLVMNFAAVAAGFGPDGVSQHHAIGSEVQRAVFPEISAAPRAPALPQRDYGKPSHPLVAA
jgi:hypothetical protein